MDNGKKNRALIVGTITYAIGNFGTKILSFLIVPLYTYYISPSDLGDYDLVITTVSLLSPLITMKISDATYRWIINNEDNEVTYISATYKLLIRNCIVGALMILGINYFIPIKYCYYFVPILIGDRILECLQKLLRGLKKQKLFAISGILNTFLMVSLNLIKVCWLGQGVTALLESNIISLYATIVFILITEKKLRKVELARNYRSHQKEMLQYSIPLVPSALSWWAMSASDRYIIRWIMGSAANGIFSVAHKFPSILQTFFSLFNNAWTDMALVEVEKGEQGEAYTKKIFEQLYRASFGMAFVLIPLTKLVMKVILSSSYKEAAIYVGFLYLGTVFQGLSSFISIGYLKGKHTAGAAKTSLYGASINLLIDILCMRYIGLYAAAISTFMGFFIMWITRMRDIREVFPIKINRLKFSIYLAIGIIISIVSTRTNNIEDIITIIVASIFFAIDNRVFIVKIISKIRKKRV